MTTTEHVPGQLDLDGRPIAEDFTAEQAATLARIDAAPAAPESHGQPLAVLLRLESLHAAATPGPWVNDSHEIYQVMPGLPDHVNAGDWLGETCRIEGDPNHATSVADADLIVAAVNALPKLTAALRAVLALADASDARVRASVPPSGAEPLIAHGHNLVRVGELRDAIREALS